MGLAEGSTGLTRNEIGSMIDPRRIYRADMHKNAKRVVHSGQSILLASNKVKCK